MCTRVWLSFFLLFCFLLLSSPPSNFNLYFHFYSSSSSPSACLTTPLNSLSSSPLHTYSHTFTTYLLILFLLHIYTSLTLILTPSPLYLSTPLLLCIFLLLFTSPTLYLTSFLLSLLSLIKAYGDPKSVDDETLNFILQPGLLEGAADVFLDFISYRLVKGRVKVSSKSGQFTMKFFEIWNFFSQWRLLNIWKILPCILFI